MLSPIRCISPSIPIPPCDIEPWRSWPCPPSRSVGFPSTVPFPSPCLGFGAPLNGAGDVILVNGDIGRHGIAIMAVREGLEFESAIESDCAPLNGIVGMLIASGIKIRCMRDLTRGGLASALVEIAEVSRLQIQIEQVNIPVREDVKGACEILGFDPLYVANEGKLIAIVPAEDADTVFAALRAHPQGRDAALIGHVTRDPDHFVQMRTGLGGRRVVDWLTGDQLPRIC